MSIRGEGRSMGSAESRKWWTLAAVSLAAFATYLDG
jgi:hypothetical protein